MNPWKPTFKKLFGSLFLGVALVVIGMVLAGFWHSASIMIPFLLPQYILSEVFGVFFSAHGGSIGELLLLVILPQWVYAYILVCLLGWLSGKIKAKHA